MIGHDQLGQVGLGDVDVKFMSVCQLWVYVESIVVIYWLLKYIWSKCSPRKVVVVVE